MDLFEPVLVTGNQFSVVGPTSLSEEDAANFLKAYCALWHPRILARAAALPRITADLGSDPGIAKPFAIVADPATAERMGPAFFSTGNDPIFFIQAHLSDFQEKFLKALERLVEVGTGENSLEERPPVQNQEWDDFELGEWAAFRGVGLGLAWVDALFETQNHTNLVDREGLFAACSNAAKSWLDGDKDQAISALREAAELLVQARNQVVGGTPRIIESVDWDEPKGAGCCPILPEALRFGLKGAIFASGETLLSLEKRFPEIIEELKANSGLVEVCGGRYHARPDSLRPLASQLWNLREGQKVHKRLLGDYCKVVVHFANDLHPVLPAIWRQNAISHGILKGEFTEGDSGYRGSYSGRSRVSIVSWSCGDGLGIETLIRQPQDSSSSLLGVDLAYHFQQSQSSDYCPILHFKSPFQGKSGWYGDFLELCRLAPVLGEHGLPSEVLRAASPGDYWSSSTADELVPDPKSAEGFVSLENREWRKCRQEIQAEWAFTSLLASLQGGGKDGEEGRPAWLDLVDSLATRELAWERGEAGESNHSGLPGPAAKKLAEWIVAKGAANTPGWLVLNPCGFMRRGIVQWPEAVNLAVEGAIKASQIEPDGTTSAVVEVPPYGFCWLPRQNPAGVNARPGRIRLADERGVRNEFLEADIDLATGDVRTIRDAKSRLQKVSIQVFGGPGNVMIGKEVRVLSQGPARGEMVSLGELVLANGEKIGEFQLRLKAWLGRPLLEVFARVEVGSKCRGEPFLRVSWRDPSMDLRRGWMGQSFRLREEIQLTGDWVEISEGNSSTTTLVPMDFPLCRRQGKRALDFPMGKAKPKAGEEHAIGIALNRDFPFLLAQGIEAPLPAVPVERGAPPSGPNGWLAMLDHAEMLVTDVRPGVQPDGLWLNWQMVSSSQEGFELGFSMAKRPEGAAVVDGLGQEVRSLDLDGSDMRVFVQRMEWLGVGTKLK